ncbi:MAG TPA: HD domain-containing protein [Anaerolineales bacterium]|nr:HD domain-containing protein [Anaerolineales bacterium]
MLTKEGRSIALTLDDIIHMTREVGEDWAVAHAKRLLELIKRIGVEIPYDPHVLELAVYLHDWGAFPKFIQKDVEHAVRSRQVVEREILPYLDLIDEQKVILLETIELHDYRDVRSTQSNESLLLREADMLEFLGMIGMAREFARGPKNVEACYKRILSRRYGIQGRFTLPRAKELAQVRLERMEQSLGWLLEESFGVL